MNTYIPTYIHTYIHTFPYDIIICNLKCKPKHYKAFHLKLFLINFIIIPHSLINYPHRHELPILIRAIAYNVHK